MDTMVGKHYFLHIFLLFIVGFSLSEKASAQSGYEQIKEWPDNNEKIDTLFNIAKYYWYHDPAKSLEIAQYALQITQNNKETFKEADALNIIGGAYYFQENIDSATYYYNKSLELSKISGYSAGISKVTNNLGLIHDFLGNYDLAIEFYYQSLEIEQDINNSVGIATAYLNIGSIYYYLQNFDKALEFMTNSLRLYQDEKNEDGILRCFTNIGSTYSEIGIYENALTYSFKALELSQKINNPDLEAANLNNIGKVYFNQNNYTKAIEYYNKALKIEEEYEDLWSQANTLRNIGGIYLQKAEYNKALQFFNRAYDIANEMDAKSLLKELNFDFYTIYNIRGDHKTALQYLLSHSDLKDSIMGESSRTEIARIESSFKLKYKDQQLELARSENEVKNLTIKTQKSIIYAVAALGLMILTLVFFFSNKARTNRREKNILEKSNALISEQKELLEQSIAHLTEGEEKYKALTSSVQDGLVIVKDRKLIFVNDVLCNLLGYNSQSELLSLKAKDILSAQNLQQVIKNHDDRIAGKEVPPEYEIKMNTKSGHVIDVSMRVKLIQYKGEPAIIGTLKDISKSKNYEKKLILAKEKAEKATLSKTMFLAGMSHEIRNQMNSIIGITDVLSETRLEKEQKDYVKIIKDSGDTLLDIINEILDLSKIEAGQVTLDDQKFSLSSILQQVTSLYELQARDRKLYLNTKIDKDLPEFLCGDVTRLLQILANLVGNALKFTDEGGITIHVACEEILKQQVLLKFKVIDSGIGISKDSQEKLFKPFSQTHAAVERKVGGTGLGLVICKHLARLMEGEIGVESSPESGSTFWFTAKLNIPESREESPDGFNNLTGIPLTKRILMVEDNLLNQHLTTTILEKGGYKTDIASNGKEGVDMFQQKQYAIVLMDIQMPVMDGIEATQLIREYEAKHSKIKSTIVAITAHSKERDRQRLEQAGIDHYLRKPFKPEDLLNIIGDSFKQVNPV